MDKVDKMMLGLMETRPLDVDDVSQQEPLRIADEEDIEELLIDCMSVVETMIERTQPKSLLHELIHLQLRLHEVLAFNRIH